MEYEFDELVRPIPVGADWWDSIKRFPERLIDQSFGYELQKTDLMYPSEVSDITSRPRTQERIKKTGYSWVKFLEDGVQVELHIPEFEKGKIDGWVEKGFLTISGQHEERQEGDGTTVRRFTRRYMVPHECDPSASCKPTFREGNIVTFMIPRRVKKDEGSEDVFDEPTK